MVLAFRCPMIGCRAQTDPLEALSCGLGANLRLDLIFGPYVFQPLFGPYIQNTPKYTGFCVFGLVGRLGCFYGTATKARKVHLRQITAQEHTRKRAKTTVRLF